MGAARGEKPSNCQEVVSAYLDTVVVILSLILSVMFGKYLSRLGWWGWTCPVWYLVLVMAAYFGGSVIDKIHETKVALEWLSLSIAVTISSLHWTRSTYWTFKTYHSANMVYVLAVVFISFLLLNTGVSLNGGNDVDSDTHNGIQLYCFLVGLGVFDLSYEESETSRYWLSYVFFVLINCIVSILRLCFPRSLLQLESINNSIVLVLMAFLTRSWSQYELVLLITLTVICTVLVHVIISLDIVCY